MLLTLATHSQASLVHRYSFATDGTDSVGGATAVLFDGASISGGALDLTGNGPATASSNPGVDYADLPIGGTVAGLSNATFEAFITYEGGNDWQRAFSLNNDTNQYIFLTPKSGLGGNPSVFETKNTPGPGVQRIQSTQIPSDGSLHQLVGVIDQANNQARFYIDGVRVATDNDLQGFTPSDLGSTANNWLGRSAFGNDAGLNGTITEFRVWDQALTNAEVFANSLAGPDALASFDGLAPLATAEWNFRFADADDNVQGAEVTDGLAVGDGSLFSSSPITPQEDAGNNGHNMFGGGQATYRTYDPAAEGIADRVGVDGFAMEVNGRYPFWFDSNSPLHQALATNSKFSGFARTKRTADGDDFESILSRPFNWRIGVDNDGTIAAVFGGVSFDTGVGFGIGDWHDIAFTYDGDGSAGGLVTLYLDGIAIGSFNAGAFGTGDVFHIGDGPGASESYIGLFDQVGFFSEALDAESVLRLTSAPIVPEPTTALLGLLGMGGLALRRRRAA